MADEALSASHERAEGRIILSINWPVEDEHLLKCRSSQGIRLCDCAPLRQPPAKDCGKHTSRADDGA